MQLPTSGPGSHPSAQAPYQHVPPPNMVVSGMGHMPNMQAQSGPPTPCPPHMGHMGPPMPPHMINEHMMRGNPPHPHGTPGPPHPMFNPYGPPSQQNPYPPGMPQPMGTPGFVGMEMRIHDMNRRLHHKNRPSPQDNVSDSDNNFQWWNAFASDFFEDDAVIKLTFKLEDGPHFYKIGRVLIPRYFRSIFSGGVKELYYVLRHPCNELIMGPNLFHFECGECIIVTKHDKPAPGPVEVHTECRLRCIFSSEEMNAPLRIKEWVMEINGHEEFIPRQTLPGLLATLPPAGAEGYQEQLTKDITRNGLSSSTLKYLKLCAILEPMQILMSVTKTHAVAPKDALKNTLVERHQHFEHMQRIQAMQHHRAGPPQGIPPQIAQLPPEEPTRPPPKSRKRNRKSSNSAGGTQASKKKNASPAPQPPILPTTSHVDVMVVSEPSLMGGEYGDEDERVISRLENTQYDPNAVHCMPPQHRPPMGLQPIRQEPPGGFEGWPPGGFPGPLVTTPQGRGTPLSQTPVTSTSRTGTPVTGASFECMTGGSPMHRGSTPNSIRHIKTEEGTNN